MDIEAAKEELQKAKDDTKLEGLMLVPFPLGEVFEMGAKQMALIVPSAESIMAAGAPDGMDPVGQQVPLFGCMDLVENREDGSLNVPLFMSMGEAQEAMDMAMEGVGEEDKQKFRVTIIPLAGAVQMQASSGGEKSFTYVPSRSSVDYLRSMQ